MELQLYELFKTLVENQQFQHYGLVGLFVNALLSATALPIPTEILTSALLAGGEPKINVFVILVIGSVIGGILNYWIGFGGSKIFHRFRKNQPKPKPKDGLVHKLLGRYEKSILGLLDKYAPLVILFSPFILVVGDVILISAGARKYNFRNYMVLMVIGKIIKVTITVFAIGLLPF